MIEKKSFGQILFLL